MVEQLLNHIQRHKLCKTNDKILLAVSGGVDSMVMLQLFTEAGFEVGVAHCNYGLRGAESDQDEGLVREVCKSKHIAFHSTHFETRTIADQKKESIQVVARELRYDYFKSLIKQHGYQYVATAHHLNDSLETILMNLTRGTGMDGIAGIPVKKGSIIRPLLFASRHEILQYAASRQLVWRDDRSNESDDYNRNFIRHHVVPKLRDINPNLEETFKDSADRLNGMIELAKESLSAIRNEAVSGRSGATIIDLTVLKARSYAHVILWELIKQKGFNIDQCKLIIQEHQSGKTFFSSEFRLLINRDELLIEPVTPGPESFYKLIGDHQQEQAGNGLKLLISSKSAAEFNLSGDPSVAQLDAELVKFPLIWRTWNDGDTFRPLGMRGQKKLSDFLIDEKVVRFEKNKITVLESDGQIIWVVGMRISDTFKVTGTTKNILIIESTTV